MENSEKIEGKKLNHDCIFHIISFLEDKDKFRLFSLDKTINENKKKIKLGDWYSFTNCIELIQKFRFTKIKDVAFPELLPIYVEQIKVVIGREDVLDLLKFTNLVSLKMKVSANQILNSDYLPKSLKKLEITNFYKHELKSDNISYLKIKSDRIYIYSEIVFNLQGFTNLIFLELDTTRYISRMSFPKSLKYLKIKGRIENFTKIIFPDLTDLPNLTHFGLIGYPCEEITFDNLPKSVIYLELGFSLFPYLYKIPKWIKYLKFYGSLEQHYREKLLKKLPNLVILKFSHNFTI